VQPSHRGPPASVSNSADSDSGRGEARRTERGCSRRRAAPLRHRAHRAGPRQAHETSTPVIPRGRWQDSVVAAAVAGVEVEILLVRILLFAAHILCELLWPDVLGARRRPTPTHV